MPLRAKEARMYVCGMTVYDYCHLGHARVMVVFDLAKRWFATSGFDVTYVRNITDIDDKIIRRAQEANEPVSALTERFIRAMDEDAAAQARLPSRLESPPAVTTVPAQVPSHVEDL